MRLAFSTACVPSWDILDALARAKAIGFDGVELHRTPDRPGDVARAAKDAALAIPCLSTPAAFSNRRTDDQVGAGVIQSAVDAARELACPFVRLLDIAGGRAGDADLLRFGDFLAPLADYALERDVTLLVENALTLRTARPLWTVLDRLSHPALGVCWNVLPATLAGESPHVSVPTLNARIHHVHLTDARLDSSGGVTLTQLGNGQLPLRPFLTRLRGVGYAGFLSVAYDDLGPSADEFLAESLKRLRDWTKPQIQPKSAKPAAASAKAIPSKASDAAPASAQTRPV